MARQTRQQRRARRERQAETAPAAVPRAARREAVGQAEAPAVETPARRPPGVARGRFIAESWAELQKVEWPGQKQVMQGTAVVLIACAIVGAYLWSADLVLKRLVENVFLGQ
jgi:preprotein translocase subunit SecE